MPSPRKSATASFAAWPAARPRDIERAGEAVRPAARKRIHVFCATSKIHREHKLKKGKEQIIQLSVESVRQARGYTDDVEFSPEDASRTELEFLEEIVQAAVEAGATTVNLPDTVGYATPKTYGQIFSHLLAKLPILKQKNVVLSCHCHDDLGLAVANSLAAIESGARQAECTVNGIGERAATRPWRKSSWPSARAAIITKPLLASTPPKSIPSAGWSAR